MCPYGSFGKMVAYKGLSEIFHDIELSIRELSGRVSIPEQSRSPGLRSIVYKGERPGT